MITRFIIDLSTGLVARLIAGVAESDDLAAVLTAGDTMECEVIFMAGDTDRTAETLAGSVNAVCGVRAVPGVEPLLALSTPIVLGEDNVGRCTLDLFTTEIMAFAATLDPKFSAKVYFETVVGGLTVAQVRMTLRREVVAEGDEPPAAAEASRISAASSAAAAQADREAADADAQATAADRGQTGLDRVATGEDRTATAADREQTSLDRTATGEDRAATANDRAQTGQDRIATGGDRTATADDRTAVHIEKLAADADAAATATDRVQTGLDRTAADTAAAAAAASAAGAAAIAAGNLYPLVFTLAGRDSLVSDGVTAGRRMEWTLGAAGAVGGRSLSIPFEFQVPTSNPGAEAFAFVFGPVVSGSNITAYTAPWMLLLSLSNAGALVLRQGGSASTLADYRQLSYTGFRAAYSGLRIRGCVVFASPDSTTPPVIYINGMDTTASFTATSATSGAGIPNWAPASLDTTRYLVGYLWPAGRMQPSSPILGTLSAAEVLDWTQCGRFPAWCEVAVASTIDCITNHVDRDFSGAGHWSPFGSGATAMINSGALDVSLPGLGSTASGIGLNVGSYFSNMIPSGHRYRLSCVISNYSKTSGSGSLVWYWSSVGSIILAIGGNGTFVAEFTVAAQPAGGGTLRLGEYGAAWAGSYTIENISLIELGPVFRPIVQPILAIADAGTNRLAGVLTGYTPVTDRRDWAIQADTNTSGNQQLLGTSLFTSASPHVIDDWCMETAGTPTVTAGSASGASAYKASGALSATKNLISLVTRVPLSVNFWAGSSTTDPIKHTIRGHRVD